MNYKQLSLIQAFFMFLTAISIFDYGLTLVYLWEGRGIFFNKLIFGIDFLPPSLWAVPQFWGYCLGIVAIIQLVKAIKFANWIKP